jgi:hypothetical protein
MSSISSPGWCERWLGKGLRDETAVRDAETEEVFRRERTRVLATPSLDQRPGGPPSGNLAGRANPAQAAVSPNPPPASSTTASQPPPAPASSSAQPAAAPSATSTTPTGPTSPSAPTDFQSYARRVTCQHGTYEVVILGKKGLSNAEAEELTQLFVRAVVEAIPSGMHIGDKLNIRIRSDGQFTADNPAQTNVMTPPRQMGNGFEDFNRKFGVFMFEVPLMSSSSSSFNSMYPMPYTSTPTRDRTTKLLYRDPDDETAFAY